MIESIELWTDGSVRPTNPGPHGGWGVVIVGEKNGEKRYRAISGYYGDATNQRSEAYGALYGLQTLNRPCTVRLCTDSQYVIRSIQRLQERRNRPTESRLPKANRDIWLQFIPLVDTHTVELADNVYGHSGIKLNEWADALAYNVTVTCQGVDQYYDEIPPDYKKRVKHASRTEANEA